MPKNNDIDLLSPVFWNDGKIRLLAQTRLPAEEVWLDIDRVEDLARAIRELEVRGAPAIGVAAALGVALAAWNYSGNDPEQLKQKVEQAARLLASTRPTAVNLFWAIERMRRRLTALSTAHAGELKQALLEEAQKIRREDIDCCLAIGRHGAELLPERATVLTHCNAGALATAGYGTALGVIRAAVAMGKKITVIADETRPLLQGARLTVWELMRAGIEVKLICDNMAGALMRAGRIDACLVGADRIAANGDTANKIGTYTVAVLAYHHHLPFYVAAPTSTIDLSLADGSAIPIEERSAREVCGFGPVVTAPEGTAVFNPAFDVTPAGLITSIITEKGIARGPDFAPRLAEMCRLSRNRES